METTISIVIAGLILNAMWYYFFRAFKKMSSEKSVEIIADEKSKARGEGFREGWNAAMKAASERKA